MTFFRCCPSFPAAFEGKGKRFLIKLWLCGEPTLFNLIPGVDDMVSSARNPTCPPRSPNCPTGDRSSDAPQMMLLRRGMLERTDDILNSRTKRSKEDRHSLRWVCEDPLNERCLRQPRSDGINPDPVSGPLAAKVPRQLINRRLARSVRDSCQRRTRTKGPTAEDEGMMNKDLERGEACSLRES